MAAKEIAPSLCVVPIVGIFPNGNCGPFLGTGVFVDEKKLLVTCNHVLRQWEGEYAISAHEDNPTLYKAAVLRHEAELDLACLKVDGYHPPYVFPLAKDDEITLNQLVCSFEYGTTDVVGNQIDFSPANRMGNVTRIRNLTKMFGKSGDHMLELSFPALKGASGAPVITWMPPFHLWGIVSQNIARELHPAQIEKVLDEGGSMSEETRFYLPQGLAIHVKHVRSLLEGI